MNKKIHFNMKTQFILFAVLALSLVSCSASRNSAQIINESGTDQNITEKQWKLIELTGNKIPVKARQNSEAHFILKTGDNKVAGNGGCNSFSGTYELLEGNRIRFSKMISTMMACENMDTEYGLLKVFETADNYTLKGDTLSLNKARMTPLAKFEAVFMK
jgi:heat shock protein HslJ